MSITLGELAERFDCLVEGDPATLIESVGTLNSAGPRAIAFLANPHYRGLLEMTRAAAVILGPGDAEHCPVAALIHPNPYLVYARVARIVHPEVSPEPGISDYAAVDESAQVAEGASVGPFASIAAGAVVGNRSVVGPGCTIGAGAVIGEDCHLVARVSICANVGIGDRAIIHPGVVIGGDGFGIASDDGQWVKVPQLGSVRLGNDVEVGANTTIDRGTIEDTVIGDGVKLDNQIQVGHNVEIGDHTVIAGCVGISGSTVIGKRCMVAGQVGIAGHLEIADDVVITGQTVVGRSITKSGVYSGALAMEESGLWRRNAARFRKLDDMARRLRRLEKRWEKKVDDEGGTDD
jgi:UDP-3-O-[3-hydroxymyristoyl] glucosamine N-acyltransferase